MIRTVVMGLAIVVPIQTVPAELANQGVLGFVVFFAILVAQGLLELLRRWKPAKGSNGDIVNVLQGIQSESSAIISGLAALEDSWEKAREHDREVAEIRHRELLAALERRSA